MPTNYEDLAIFPGSELELIRRFVQAEGLSKSSWLLGSGLEQNDTMATTHAISIKQFDAVYRNVYRLANRPTIGIDFGVALNLSRWGALSSALLCANSLGHALAIADEFKEILRSRFTISNQQEGKNLLIKLSPNSELPFPINETFAHEVFLGSLNTQISQLLGKPFRFNEIKLPYSQPLHFKYYQKLAERPVQFGAQSAQLSIPIDLIRQNLPMTNRVTRKIVISQCREELDRVKNAKSGDIVFTIRGMLSQSGEQLPSLSQIALKLSMSPRTLRRHLEKEDIQFRQLCEQERQQRAISLLSSQDLSLKDIGKLCGFKEYASFHKAFKRWTNESPGDYKKRSQRRT